MAFAALKRLGQSLLGNDTLRKVQQHLERDEGALAWREACSESWSSAEGLATSAVAAGCCGHWDEAAEILQRVESLPAVSVEEHLACQALLHRVCALREQQQTGQGLLCGPLWCPEPPALELPASWSSWARALPQVAEYVGPVEVRWTEGSERGLFTSRAVEAGEVLMVAQPIAFAAQNGPLLVAELRRKCAVSQRARRRLECLADGGARGSTVSPEEVTQELFIRADEPPGEPTVEASPEGDLRLQDILNHNVFVVDHSGEAALYGLPSMLNHSCDVTALKLVLVFFEKAMIFIATRDLEKGEELCHRYFDVEGSVRERRGESSKWGFSCDCCRCHFEANTLLFSDCGKAVEAAVTLFQAELRYDMRALSQAAEVKAEVEQKRWPLLQRLLSAVDAVEDAAWASGWSEKELAWSLALVQKLSNAALWCLLTHRSAGAANGGLPHEAPKDPLAVRCLVLRRLELALRHSEAFGFDHLQNLHLLWSALEEVRVSVLARAAIQLKPQVLEPMVGPVPGRVPAPWSRLASQEFLAQVRALGLRSFLQQEGGLVQVKDFLPMDLAQEMLEMLKALAQDEWYLSENQSSVDAEHRFWRYEGQKLDKVKSIMQERSALFRFSSRVIRQSLKLRPLHPNGRLRLTWDVTSLMFLSYDVFYIPFTALDPPRSQVTDVIDWSILIFWSLDMILSNVTAFYLRGELVTSFSAISWQYLRTWFLLDLLVIVPDWFGQISAESMEGDSVRVVRSLLRSLRCLRLLRLLKLQKLLAMVYDLSDSEMTFIAFTCARLVFGIFVLTHFIACAWYYLGTSMAASGPSWTSSETGGEAAVQDRDLLYRYSTSLHWSLTQFTPASMEITARNTAERAFSIMVLFFSLLVFSSVIGQVTTSMMSLQNLQACAKKDFWRLRRFLRNRQVPPASRTRIIRYLESQVYKDRGHVQQKDIKILALLSEPLRNLLSWELHRRLLTKHRLFDVLQQCIEPMVVRLTSVALSVSALAEQDVPFCAGESAERCLFVVSGQFLYQPVQESQLQRELSGGEWLVEACLWTEWHHLGTMSTLQAGELCQLHPEKFADVMQMHVWPWDLCQRYASDFLELLNAQDVSRRSDMFWHPKLQDEVHIKNLCTPEIDWDDTAT